MTDLGGEGSPILLYGDSYRVPNIYYVTHFLAPDPFIYLSSDSGGMLVVSRLEKERAVKQSRIQQVRSYDELGLEELLERVGDRNEAAALMMAKVLEESGQRQFRVEGTFPLFFADRLRQHGFELEPDPNLLVSERRHKSPQEIEALAKSQKRAEGAIQQAADILAESVIGDGSLLFRGVPLTSERLRSELAVSFARDGFASESMIIAPGPGSSDPHWTGTGPVRPMSR